MEESPFTVFQAQIRNDGRWRRLGEHDGRKVLEGTDEEIGGDLRRQGGAGRGVGAVSLVELRVRWEEESVRFEGEEDYEKWVGAWAKQ